MSSFTYWCCILLMTTTVRICVSRNIGPSSCLPKLDIAFAVDASYSIGKYSFRVILNTVKEIASRLDVAQDGVRISLLQFSDNAHVEFYLDQAKTRVDVDRLVDATVYTQGNTETGHALKRLREEVFTQMHGDRPDVQNLVIVFTDGSSSDYQMLANESRNLNDSGAVVFVVSIGYLTDPGEMTLMAGPHVVRVHSANELDSHTQEILDRVCKVFGPTRDTSLETSATTNNANDIVTTGGKATSSLTTSSTPSATQEPPVSLAPCQAKYVDLVLVVDASNSVGPDNFHKVKTFVTSLVDTLNFTVGLVRFGVIQFSDDAEVVIPLGNLTTKAEIKEAVMDMQYTGGGTNTASALELLASQVFSTPRRHVPQLGVVITDGLSRQMILTRLQANILHHMGVQMFSIGIGTKVSKTEMETIASQPSQHYVFTVDNFETLAKIESRFAISACNDALHNNSSHLNNDSSLSDVTTTATPYDRCQDAHDKCHTYGRDMCSDYEHWAREHCALTCEFCVNNDTSNSSNTCKDNISNCQAYGSYYCHDPTYFEWVQENCAKHCGLCDEKQFEFSSPTKPVDSNDNLSSPPPTTQQDCVDTIPDCDNYGGQRVCHQYHAWASVRCRAYCGFCVQYYNVSDAFVADGTRCPQWKLPVECSLKYENGNCCPLPSCPDGYILTATPHSQP